MTIRIRRNQLILVLCGLLSIVSSCTEPTSTEGGTTDIKLFSGGTILTVDESFSEVEAMAIEGNEIIAIGSLEDVRAQLKEGFEEIDLGGKVMLPGFIDPHFHVVAGGIADYSMEYIGMERFRTTTEVLDRIRERVTEADSGEWIGLRGWDPGLQDGPAALTFEILDPLSKSNPIFIINASGHIAYANRLAFEAAGIDNEVENPEGAEYVRDMSGNVNGVMKNMVAFTTVWMANPEARNVQLDEAIIKSTERFSKLGFTTVSELALGAFMGSTQEIDALYEVASTGRLKTRIRAYPSYIIEESMDQSDYHMSFGDDLVKLSGFKLVADGSNQGFTGLQREPYYCCNAGHGQEYTSPEELKRLVNKQAAAGWQLAIHGNGDQAIDNILDALEEAKDNGHELIRPRIEHASILHDDQIARMKELGVSPSFLIGHVHYWGVFMRDSVFGPEKVQLLDRTASVHDAGLGFTIHSDYPVTNPNPMHMIEMAVTRKTWKEPEYVLAPDERVSVELAIRAITSEAAWQLMSDDRIGSLEVGKLADFVVISDDPRNVEPDRIKDIQVLETWMNGQKMN